MLHVTELAPESPPNLEHRTALRGLTSEKEPLRGPQNHSMRPLLISELHLQLVDDLQLGTRGICIHRVEAQRKFLASLQKPSMVWFGGSEPFLNIESWPLFHAGNENCKGSVVNLHCSAL